MDAPAKKGISTSTILMIIGAVVLGFIVFIVALFVFIFGTVNTMMTNSPVYQEAVTLSQSNAIVVQEIGDPIKTGRMTTGSISTSGGSGNADLAIPLKGPDGKATAYVSGVKTAGVWEITSLTVAIKETDERIVLVD